MDNWVKNDRVRPLEVAFTTIVIIFAYLLEEAHLTREARHRKPSLFQDQTMKKHMECILRSGQDYCVSYL